MPSLVFLRAIDGAPDWASIRKDLAYTYLKIGETEAARDQFAEALRLDPKDTHLALEYAFLCFETKKQAHSGISMARSSRASSVGNGRSS